MRIKVAGRPSDELMLPIAVQWTPLKPLKAAVSLLIRQVRACCRQRHVSVMSRHVMRHACS
jgi:hypothetical protein